MFLLLNYLILVMQYSLLFIFIKNARNFEFFRVNNNFVIKRNYFDLEKNVIEFSYVLIQYNIVQPLLV